MIDYIDGLLRKYFGKIKVQKKYCCSMAEIDDVKNETQKYDVESYQKKIVYKK